MVETNLRGMLDSPSTAGFASEDFFWLSSKSSGCERFTGDAKKLDCFSPPSLHTEPKLGACTFWILVVVLDNLLATFYCKTFLLRDISILDWQCFRAPVQVFLLKTTGLLSFHNRNIQFLIMQHVLPRVPLPTLIVLSFLLDSLITQGEQTTFTSSWRKLVLSNRNIGQINFPFIAVPSALRNRNQKNSNLLLLHTLVYYSREFENKLDFISLSVFEWHSVVNNVQ